MTGTESTAYRGNQHRETLALREWHARCAAEPALEPGLPIVDPHHHLFGRDGDALFYRREDLQQDLAAGHRVLGTVYVEAYQAGWRASGPTSLRSVGEVERIAKLAATPIPAPHGACRMAAGIVSQVDLTLGDAVEELLQAHVAAGEGRLRGVRHHTTWHEGALGRFIPNAPVKVMAEAAFRRGFAWLGRSGLAFDALIYHTQLGELAQLADAFPDTSIVLNHLGMAVGVEEFRAQRAAVFQDWREGLRALAARPNVRLKVGGMGMPIFGFGFEWGEAPAASQDLLRQWQPFIATAIETFGTGRCMFESNFPVDRQSCAYGALWNAFKLATRALSEDERRDLFYRTACRTYRLPELQQAGDAVPARAWPGPDQ